MNMNTVEAHMMKANVAEDLAKKVNAQAETPVANTNVTKPEEVPFNSGEALALANNPDLVEGHLNKWRGVAK